MGIFQHVYDVKVIGKSSAGYDISTTKTSIHASSEAEAKQIAKSRCGNFAKITKCEIIRKR